jgi:hypothetical protein
MLLSLRFQDSRGWYKNQLDLPAHTFFLDNGLHNPASTSRDVHSQKVQTKTGLGKQAKLKNFIN